MSNWKACIPANPKYEGAKNMIWVTNVSVVPHEGASIKVQVHYQNGALANEFITIGGDEYKEWAADDKWIYHKVATKLALGVLADGDNVPSAYVPIDDGRSVHNQNDIETINTLQAELDQQKAKIEQINKLLISRGIL